MSLLRRLLNLLVVPPAQRDAEVVTLRLCEAERLLLRPNVLYLFTVKPDCARCVELEQRGRT